MCEFRQCDSYKPILFWNPKEMYRSKVNNINDDISNFCLEFGIELTKNK